MEKLWAVRGATTIPKDTAEEVLAATEELLKELFSENRVLPESIVSIIFTVTPDITSEFPAVAARALGLAAIPLMCAQEVPKPGALPLCIRIMVHFYTELPKEALKPVYLGNARQLRPDLFGVESAK